ncbi:MAG: acyl-CoA dehydrogenase, partial [Gammaproteobacteria bacterium]|nr:acyl-CoA dehydrogenase [Gammaproteobacteria bacterium]
LDQSRFHPDEQKRKKAADLVALLIPVQKAYCSDRGFDSCVLGQQVLGGHGYVAEWGLEQNVRDARIAQIYEGTNGVQALDLMGRKTVRCNGELLAVLVSEIEDFQQSQKSVDAMQSYLQILEQTKVHLVETTEKIIASSESNPDEVGAASYAYMELMGLSLFCFMWVRMIAAALNTREESSSDKDYLDSLIKTGDFFFARLLPKGHALAAEISAGSGTLMAMTAEQF